MENIDIIENLSDEEIHKMAQFQDLTGFEQIKCLQILRANDWNLEIALDLAFDGAYTDIQTTHRQVPPVSISHENNSYNQLRHRRTNTANTSPYGENEVGNVAIGVSPEEPAGLHIVLWNTTTWLFKLPFIIVINTFNSFYDFFANLIRPTLNYDATGTVERYINEFEDKYGIIHPVFHRGSYTQILDLGKRDIRFIVIYLHSPSHRDTDAFCTNVIATQRFSDFINTENAIFWSCSIYYPEGYKVFQSFKVNTYPFVGLIGLKNHKMVAMKRIEGYYDLVPFLNILKEAMVNNEYSLIAARLDREERNMSTLIRAQQDADFEESLRVDQEKERKRKEVEEEKAKEERLKKEKEDAIIRRQEKITWMKSSLLTEIPAEPEANGTGSIRIMFKLPNGKRLERRFLNTDPVKYLYYYVFCHDEELVNFKIVTNFPKRDLPGYSPSPETNHETDNDENGMGKLLEHCNLENNVMLFVHDLDS